MDRTRGAKRSTMAASNGLSRQRQRTSDMGDGHAEMQKEGLTLRGRPEKKEQYRAPLNRSKRRRSERCALRDRRDKEDDSSEDSLIEEDGPISQNSASFQQNYIGKSFPQARVPRHATAKTGMGLSLKVADEMIGVPVPRKARSACVKRAYDCWTSSGSGGGRIGEDHRRPPASPASYSFEAVSPSSSAVSIKQKMNASASESCLPKPLKSFDSAEEDLEIEIAEVLSGLKKQPRSKKEDDSENSLESSEIKVSKKIKGEGDDSSYTHVENGSITPTVITENGLSGNMQISMATPEKSTGFSPESLRAVGDQPDTFSGGMDTQNEAQKQEQPGSLDGVKETESLNSLVTKETQEGSRSKRGRDENNTDNKLEIDLMFPPLERDPLLLLASDHRSVAQDSNKLDNSGKSREKVMGKKETSPDEGREKKVGNHEWLGFDLKKPNQDNLKRDLVPRQQQLQAISAQSSSAPPLLSAVTGGCWPPTPNPNGISPLGYVPPPPLQAAKPIVTGSSPKLEASAASFVASQSQPRPKRCATHFFIARNIQLHQQFVKTNNLWAPNSASAPLNGGASRPNHHLYAIPHTAADGFVHANPSPREALSIVPPDQGRIVAHIPTSKDKASESSNSSETTQKKQQQQQLPAASTNLVPAPTLIFPIKYPQQPAMGADASHLPVPSKSVVGSAKIPSLAAGGGGGGSTSPYLTSNGYPFQVSTAAATPKVGGGAAAPALPFFNGSLYSTQMIQPPQHLQKQGKETAASSGSSSSHKQPHHPHVGVQKSSYGQKNMTAPLQPMNYSFPLASFGGTGAPSCLNFTPNGYHMGHAPLGAQQKNQWKSDSKTLVFDNSSTTLNFASVPWPPHAVTSGTTTTNHPLSTQKPRAPQMQQSSRSKLMTTNTSPATPVASKSPQWSNPANSSLLSSCSSSSLKQQQIKTHGQTHISFAAAPKPVLAQPSQRLQERPSSSHPQFQQQAPLVAATATHSKRSSTVSSKTEPPSSSSYPTAQPQQQMENSASGSNQKASPLCGRTVPSIISSCPGHLSELKY